MDEMIITNGIVYSVSKQKECGLCELPSHAIKSQIYQEFYEMNSEESKIDKISETQYFESTASKLSGYTATGLTQVGNLPFHNCKYDIVFYLL